MFGLPDVLGIKAALIAGGVSLLVGTYAGYRLELGAYERHLMGDAKAQLAVVTRAKDDQHRIDMLNQGDAEAQAYFRGKMDATTIRLVLGAPSNVTIAQDESAAASGSAGCITFGFARMLYAGAHGGSTESIQLPSGESVDTCTALKPSDLAAAAAQDLAAGYSNAHQLDALIAAVKRNDAIATAP